MLIAAYTAPIATNNVMTTIPAITFLLEEGDVLFARSGATVGKAFVFKKTGEDACFAGYLVRVRTERQKLLPEFLYFFTQSMAYHDYVRIATIQATIENVSSDKYANLPICLPDIDNQKAIVNFLSYRIRHLEILTADKKTLIQLLQEQRQAVINQTITTGLDPNVPMKDSGIEWIGKIP